MAQRLTSVGAVGAVLAAVCCVTPLLPWVLGALGFSGIVGYVYRDEVLLPILGVSLLIMGVGIWLRRRAR